MHNPTFLQILNTNYPDQLVLISYQVAIQILTDLLPVSYNSLFIHISNFLQDS